MGKKKILEGLPECRALMPLAWDGEVTAASPRGCRDLPRGSRGPVAGGGAAESWHLTDHDNTTGKERGWEGRISGPRKQSGNDVGRVLWPALT